MYMSRIVKSGNSILAPDPVYHTAIAVEDVRFRKLVENSQDGIALFDKDLNVIYRSQSAERITGWKAQDRTDKEFKDIIYSDDRARVRADLTQSLSSPGLSVTSVYRVKHFEGHFIWLESIFTNMLADQDINAIVCNFRDISQKKQAEDLLQQTINELFAYKYALDESAIVAITDQKGIIKHVNANFCRISKFSETELIGQDHRIINSGYHDKAFIRSLWATIANGQIWKGELKNKAKDGSYYWVDTTIVPFLNGQGKPYQYVAIRSDITERKLFQEKIIESESFIKTITNNLPVMIAYWGADMKCLFANKPYMDWFEKQPDEILGIHKKDLLDKEEFKRDELHIQNVLNGVPQSFERSFRKNGGKITFTHTQYLPDKQDHTVKGFYSLIYDITEIKLAEAVGKHALEERNTILESIDDAFFAVDRNWVVSYWNKMAEKVLFTPKNKILNHNLWDVFADSIGSESYKKYHQAIETNQAVHFEDYYSILDKWYEISAYPAETGLSVYFKDITDRKTAEIQLKELNENLQKHAKELAISNAELEQFAYVASHDLQEPLRMVTSFLTQLEKKYGDVVDDKGRQYIHFAVDGAKRMRQIILDLLEYSRVGRTEEDLEEVNFNGLVEEILTLYRRQTQELHARFNFENLPIIQTYKTPVRQVFQNLIGNSLKYHKANEAPVISITSKETKTHFQFSIEDNGIGIAPEYFDKIFIIFQRLHNKDEYSGTGMGLAIAKKIIENLGGKIWIESREGKGSTFYFTLIKNECI
jgi:PAS domain S-box-containing protein